ncbi:MAG: adaptor protein MecA [Firmicutes bacterium]|nr:adaptor protein MecA [Bacillota bacterium]
MKMEKLNDYQIKFLLTRQDLQERNITFNDLFQRSDKLQSLVREIMKLASEKINFNVSENPVMVEARPHPDGIALIVSRTPEKTDNSSGEEYKRHLSELYNELVEHKLFDDNIIDNNTEKEQKSDRNTVTDFIYSFGELSGAIKACSIAAPDYHSESALYKMNDEYYLVLRCSYSELSPAVRNCFIEYGEFCPLHSGSVGMLTEYGKTIIAQDAVGSLAKCK